MLFKEIKKHLFIPKWLFAILIIVTSIRIPTLFEPYSYGDEMIYITIGEAIKQGLTLYKDIHDNKPPLIYFTAAIAGSLFWLKAILAVWNLITIVLFWKLTKKIFDKTKNSSLIATLTFAILTNIPLLEGNIANAEIFMVGFTIISFLFLLKKNPNYKDYFWGGIFLAIAGLYKIPALIDFLAILLIFAYKLKATNSRQQFLSFIKSFTYFLIGILVPFIFVFVWYTSKGAIGDYTAAVFSKNIDYLSSWRMYEIESSFFAKNLPLFIRFSILIIAFVILFVKRLEIGYKFAFATAWIISSAFAVSLSERPYPHYLIQAVPGVSLMLSYFFTEKSKLQVYSLIPLLITFAIPFYYKFWYYPSVSYYKSFISFAIGKSTKEEYFNTFDKNTNRNYKIAQYINNYSSRYDKIFVWEDSAPIYAITKKLPTIKYIAGYHIEGFGNKKELVDQMQKKPPTYIVILPESKNFEELEKLLSNKYTFADQIEGAKIWRKIH